MYPFMMDGGLGMLALRLAVAAVFIVHALPKLQKPDGMAAGMKWSKEKVQVLGAIEMIGALSLITGIAMHIGGLLLVGVMIGAIYMKTQKWHVPFKADDKTGWELDLLLLTAALAIACSAPGFIGMMGRWY